MSAYKWYRLLRGGTWYYVTPKFSIAIGPFWSRKVFHWEHILRTEYYIPL